MSALLQIKKAHIRKENNSIRKHITEQCRYFSGRAYRISSGIMPLTIKNKTIGNESIQNKTKVQNNIVSLPMRCKYSTKIKMKRRITKWQERKQR